MLTDPLMKRMPLIAAILIISISACISGWQLFHHFHERYRFPQVECEVVNTQTATERDSEGGSVYRLTYKIKYYNADLKDSGTDATSFEFYSSQQQMDAALGRLRRSRERFSCWFNPKEPLTVRLQRTSVTSIVLDLLFIFIGGPLMALLTFFMMRLSLREEQ